MQPPNGQAVQLASWSSRNRDKLHCTMLHHHHDTHVALEHSLTSTSTVLLHLRSVINNVEEKIVLVPKTPGVRHDCAGRTRPKAPSETICARAGWR